MDIERIVVRLFADASQYTAVLGAAETRLLFFSTYLTSVIGNTAIKLATDFERSQVAFEVMTKSAETGKKLLSDITNLAVESPFTSSELISNAKQLKAFGFETNDIIPILSRLGDISSGTGTDLDRLVLAFGQVRTTGRLMGQELRQFTNAGVPILEYLAKVLNVTSAQIPNLVRQGKISFSDVAKAINMMTDSGGLFEGMMSRINKETVFGRWQNLQENLQITARNFGLAAFQAFQVGDALTFLSTRLRSMDQGQIIEFMTGLRQTLEVLWEVIKRGYAVISGYVDQVAAWVGANQDAIVSGLATAAAVLGMIAVVGAAIGRFVSEIDLEKVWDGFLSGLTIMGRTAQGVFTSLSVFLANLDLQIMAVSKEIEGLFGMGEVSAEYRWFPFATLAQASLSVGNLIGSFTNLYERLVKGTDASDAFRKVLNYVFGDLRRIITVIGVTLGLITAWIVLIRTLGAVLWALNTILWAVRTAMLAVNAAMSAMFLLQGLVTLWTSFTGILALILSPIGLVTLAVIGLLYALDQMNAFDNLGKGFIDTFVKMKDTFVETWNTILALIRAGEIQKALDLALVGIEIAWKSMVIALKAEWMRFSNALGEMILGGIAKAVLQAAAIGDSVTRTMIDFMARGITGKDEEPDFIKKWRENSKKGMDVLSAQIDEQVAKVKNAQMPKVEADIQNLMKDLDPLKEKLEKMNRSIQLDMQLTPRSRDLMNQIEGFIKVSDRINPATGKPIVSTNYQSLIDSIPNLENVSPDSARFKGAVGGAFGGLGMEAVEKQHRDLSLMALLNAEDIKKAVMEGKRPTEDMIKRLNESAGALKTFNDVMDGTTARANAAAKAIATPLQIHPDVLKNANEIQKEFAKGVGPMDQFNHQLRLITEAFDGPLPEAVQNGLAAVTGFAAIVGNADLRGILTPEERDFGYFKQYEELRRKVGGKKAEVLPPAQFIGTREAQDTINKANTEQTRDVLQEVRDTVKAGLEVQKEHMEYARQVVGEVKELKNRGIIMPDLRGMNINDR